MACPGIFGLAIILEKIAFCESEEDMQKSRHSDEQIVRILRESDNGIFPKCQSGTE